VNYQVFARKYRPQNFDQVVGQDHISHTLKNAISQNRLAHAYLFVGPRGTGKTSTARILAKALNCVHGPTATPCGECDSCKEIAQGNCMDVLEIDGASNNGVEQVRDLRDNVRYAPTRGKFKIYIIDEVHMLTTAAFNALLKTLEEPPAHVKFFFATTEAQKVLPTILSRCQRFDMRRIPAHLIADHLQYIANNEGISLQDAAANAIAKGAEGGLRDAESMLDQLVAFCGNKIDEGDVLSIFGFTAQETVSALCGSIIEGATPEALHIVHEQAEAGRDLSRLMADLISHFRDLLVAKADPESIASEFGADTLAVLTQQAGQLSMERVLELIEQFAAADARMKWAPNKKLHFEIAIIKAVQTLNQVTLTEILDNLAILRSGGEVPKRPVPAPAAPRQATLPREKINLTSSLKAKLEQPAVKPPTPPSPAPAPVAPPTPAPTPQVPTSAEPELMELKEVQVVKEVNPAPEFELEAKPLEVPSIPVQENPPELGDMFASMVTTPKQPKPEAAIELETAPEEPSAAVATLELPVAVEEPVVASDELETFWPKLVNEIRTKRPLAAAWLEAGALLKLDRETCLIGFPPDQSMCMESLLRPNNVKFLEEVFEVIAGRPLRLLTELRDDLTVVPVPVPEKIVEPVRDPMEDFKDDPLIKKALELFKAELLAAGPQGK